MRRGKIKAASVAVNKDEFSAAWSTLGEAINQIYDKNASNLSFEELYRNAYNLVLKKLGDKLYNSVKEIITKHMIEMEVDYPQNLDLILIQTATHWDHHITTMLMLRDILMYMDRLYVQNASVPVVYDLGLELFRDFVFMRKNVQIVSYFLDVITKERNGENADRLLLKKITDMMLALEGSRDKIPGRSVYHLEFEPKFLSTSTTFYKIEGEKFLENDASRFILRVEQRLKEEKQRCELYLNAATEPRIVKIVENTLIDAHVTTLINMEKSGLGAMITNERFTDMNRMYKLFSRVSDGHNEMCQHISSHIRGLVGDVNQMYGTVESSNFGSSRSRNASTDETNGNTGAPGSPALSKKAKEKAHPSRSSETSGATSSKTKRPKSAKNSNHPLKWVQGILEIKDKFDAILENSLEKDRVFLNTINNAFQVSINENLKAPEYVSIFIDNNLKTGIKGKSDDEIEKLLDKTIVLFRFIHEKDIFERYYKQHLAKRLLFGKSQSEDIEKNFVSRLKTECGCQFTTKLEGMFKDMRTSEDIMRDFKSRHPSSCISVNILTCTYWPMQANNAVKFELPPSINQSTEKFKLFYSNKFSGRRITWMTNMGNADLKASYCKKEINVSTFAMSVLVLVFNESDQAHFDDILRVTGIPEAELRKTLLSLSSGKYKLLKSTSDVTDIYTLDLNFTCSLARIKIAHGVGSGKSVETETERRSTLEKVDEVRKHHIEAAIVRIMKSRKVMEHNNLVSDVLKMLSSQFKPSVKGVKQRIENLIEREYLERDKADLNKFRYLA